MQKYVPVRMLYIWHEICRYRKDVVDMCTETDNEKLIEVLVKVCRSSVSVLSKEKKTRKATSLSLTSISFSL